MRVYLFTKTLYGVFFVKIALDRTERTRSEHYGLSLGGFLRDHAELSSGKCFSTIGMNQFSFPPNTTKQTPPAHLVVPAQELLDLLAVLGHVHGHLVLLARVDEEDLQLHLLRAVVDLLHAELVAAVVAPAHLPRCTHIRCEFLELLD